MPQHILIVDDNQNNRDIYSRILTFRGYKVTLAEDGGQALDFFLQHTPDLVLLDINMPKISGFDVLRWVRCSVLHQNTKVIVITGNSVADRHPEAELADLFLQKPVSIITLQDMVARLLP